MTRRHHRYRGHTRCAWLLLLCVSMGLMGADPVVDEVYEERDYQKELPGSPGPCQGDDCAEADDDMLASGRMRGADSSYDEYSFGQSGGGAGGGGGYRSIRGEFAVREGAPSECDLRERAGTQNEPGVDCSGGPGSGTGGASGHGDGTVTGSGHVRLDRIEFSGGGLGGDVRGGGGYAGDGGSGGPGGSGSGGSGGSGGDGNEGVGGDGSGSGGDSGGGGGSPGVGGRGEPSGNEGARTQGGGERQSGGEDETPGKRGNEQQGDELPTADQPAEPVKPPEEPVTVEDEVMPEVEPEEEPPSFGELMQTLLVVLAVVFLVVMLALMIRAVMRRVERKQSDREQLGDDEEIEGAEELLSELELRTGGRSHNDWAEQMCYEEAIHALLLSALKSTLRHNRDLSAPSLTSREILRGANLDTSGHAALDTLVRAAELCVFARREGTEAMYKACVSAHATLSESLEKAIVRRTSEEDAA